ncbi:MAG: hypothetical protein MI923_21680 [Phycisphaerales bacterium]|nr:hypothetical protein [Phycisphaerales bacterium]
MRQTGKGRWLIVCATGVRRLTGSGRGLVGAAPVRAWGGLKPRAGLPGAFGVFSVARNRPGLLVFFQWLETRARGFWRFSMALYSQIS